MVSRPQDLWNEVAFIFGWSRVLGVLKERWSIACRVALVERGLRGAKCTGQQAHNRVDDHHGPDLSSGEDEVADGHFSID